MVFLLRVVIALKIDAFYLRTIIISVAVGHCKSHAGDGWITDQEAAKVFLPSLSLHLVVPPRAQWPKCAVVKKKKKTFQGDSPERMFLRWRIGGPNTTDNSFIYMQLNHWGGRSPAWQRNVGPNILSREWGAKSWAFEVRQLEFDCEPCGRANESLQTRWNERWRRGVAKGRLCLAVKLT